MKTSTLSATISSTLNPCGLSVKQDDFNQFLFYLYGQAQEVSVTTDGAVIKGDLYEVNKTIDFESIELELLQKTVLTSFNSDVVLTVTDDRELLITHLFKTVCSSQSLKALKAINDISEDEKNTLNTLNRADTFINDLLPRILCTEPVQRVKLSTGEVFNFAHFGLDAAMFATGNKSVYTMPNNGGYKVYLLEEFETEFFKLKKAGLLLPKLFAYQEEGDFAGCYAVVIPAKSI